MGVLFGLLTERLKVGLVLLDIEAGFFVPLMLLSMHRST